MLSFTCIKSIKYSVKPSSPYNMYATFKKIPQRPKQTLSLTDIFIQYIIEIINYTVSAALYRIVVKFERILLTLGFLAITDII